MEDLRKYIRELRHDFSQKSLNEEEVNKNPLHQFENWLIEAVEAGVTDAHAMVVSTADMNGKVSGRILLLRNVTENGFVFYTNYLSRKAMDIEQNPQAALTFFWPMVERQVRVEGFLEKQSAKESDDYFSTRPQGSQISALISPQSHEVKNRSVLDNAFIEMKSQLKDNPAKRPGWWGGYVLKPESIEFWQGRPSRLHDRILYKKISDAWKISRLAP